MDNIDDLHNKVKEATEQNKVNIQNDPNRLTYHLMPPVGLLNDPNGFIYFNDTYHLYYQWNPLDTKHGIKFWGHYHSTDLVNWKEAPIALSPDKPYDKNGCYSGSAIVHEDLLHIFYTGNVINQLGERETYQCLATSEDGFSFDKKGPVIYLPDGFTPHFRDPKVWKVNDTWFMILGAQDNNLQGCAVIYSSKNLYDWDFENVITGSHRNQMGDFGYMWECPDLFRLQDKDILLVCPQGLEAEGFKYNNIFQSGYFSGVFNEENVTYDHGEFIELDCGFDFYAPQTTLDTHGRRLLFAWMGITDDSEQLQPTIDYKWIHAMTIPRELKYKNGRIYQEPVVELKNLRSHEISQKNVILFNEKKCLENISGNPIELFLNDFRESNLESFNINIGVDTKLSYHSDESTFTLQRKNLIYNKPETRVCYINPLKNIRIFLDKSSIEIFLNDGENVFTARLFSEKNNNDSINFEAKGHLVFNVTKWNLNRIATP